MITPFITMKYEHFKIPREGFGRYPKYSVIPRILNAFLLLIAMGSEKEIGTPNGILE
jgi:hypothetical protein